MADCRYCGKPAGMFHHAHKECEHEYQDGIEKVRATLAEALRAGVIADALPSSVAQIASQARIAVDKQRELQLACWEEALDAFVDAGELTEAEQNTLSQFLDRFKISKESLGQPLTTKIVKAVVLREVMHGNVPTRFHFDRGPTFNFQKGEQLVWGFGGVDYLEDRTHREYVGRSAGVSIRIVKGVYYHSSAFRGRPVDVTDRVRSDNGALALTNKHIYFAGSKKIFRVPYAKIVSFEPYSDGLGIMRDAASAKFQAFITGDGWFTYNLAANLAKLG